MSISLLETVQQNLDYPALHKADPNTQEETKASASAGEDEFSQAAIPAVLTGLLRYVQSGEGAVAFLNAVNSMNSANRIFDDNRKEAIQTISV